MCGVNKLFTVKASHINVLLTLSAARDEQRPSGALSYAKPVVVLTHSFASSKLNKLQKAWSFVRELP